MSYDLWYPILVDPENFRELSVDFFSPKAPWPLRQNTTLYPGRHRRHRPAFYSHLAHLRKTVPADSPNHILSLATKVEKAYPQLKLEVFTSKFTRICLPMLSHNTNPVSFIVYAAVRLIASLSFFSLSRINPGWMAIVWGWYLMCKGDPKHLSCPRTWHFQV